MKYTVSIFAHMLNCSVMKGDECIAECFEMSDAKMICDSLNALDIIATKINEEDDDTN